MRLASALPLLAISLGLAACEGPAAPADASPVDVAPADASPADVAPADASPADVAPADAAPADAAPADVAPADVAPADASPVDVAPVDVAPADASPVDVAPVDVAPADASPVDVAPVDVAPVDVAPADAAPADAAPADAAPIDAAPADAASDVAPVIDAGAAPEGRVEVVLGSTTVILPSDGSEVGVEASCRYVPSLRLEPAPALRLRVDGPGRLEGGRVLVSRRGIVPVRCETAWPSLVGVASVTAVGAALPGAWARAGRPLAAITSIYADLERADRADDRAAILAGATRLSTESRRLQRLASAGLPAVWGWPGGWPAASALSAAGLAPGPDDAAAMLAIADVRSALATLRTAWAMGPAGGSATLAAIAAGQTRLDAAVRRFRALRPSAHTALIQRDAVTLLLRELVSDGALVGDTVARALPTQLPPAPGSLLLDVGLGLLLGGSIQAQMVDQMYGPAIAWIENAAATAATLAVLARSYVPTPAGPAIASINRSNVIFVGRPFRVYGERFSLNPEHNMLVAVSGSAVTSVGGVLQSCLALRSVPRPTGFDFINEFWSYIDSAYACVEGLTDGTLTMAPTSGTFGTGPVVSAEESVLGVMEWDAPPIGLSGPTNALPLTVGLIPVNLEGGMQRAGSPLTVLYYR